MSVLQVWIWKNKSREDIGILALNYLLFSILLIFYFKIHVLGKLKIIIKQISSNQKINLKKLKEVNSKDEAAKSLFF